MKEVTKEELKAKALDFLRKQKLMVLGTSQKDLVWSATVHFAVTDKFELIFLSRPDSRHGLQIDKNPHVSGVVTSEKTQQSIQIAGLCRIADGAEWNTYFQVFEEKFKNAGKRVDQVVYVVNSSEVWMIDEKLVGGRLRKQVI